MAINQSSVLSPQLSHFLTTDDRRLEFFNRYLVISIDAHFARNLHCFFGDLTRGQLGVLGQRLRGCLGIGAAAADGRDAAVGLDYVTLSAQKESLLLVGDQQQSFEV